MIQNILSVVLFLFATNNISSLPNTKLHSLFDDEVLQFSLVDIIGSDKFESTVDLPRLNRSDPEVNMNPSGIVRR
jgi:hypothetical protein